MKLLLCRACQDVIKLAKTERTCACGAVGGQYLEDGLNATYWGANAVPLGFANSTLVEAVQNRPESGMGYRFTAFVIPQECPTMKREKKNLGEIHVVKENG
jgi:hypothetical protein